MKKSENKDVYCIVGWGLAGSVLAWQFYFEDRSFQVYDSGENHSTRTAVGLVNPVIFKRLTKSWNADKLLPHAAEFYKKVETELGVELLSRKNIYRIFSGVEEQNNWSSRQGDDRFEMYLKAPNENEMPNSNEVEFPFGLGVVETIGSLDTNLFLDASKEFFKSREVAFFDKTFDYNSVKTSVNYVFCEGVGVKNNPYFNYLPLRPTHGETLEIETKGFSFDHVINKNMFIMPLGNYRFKVGATYNWELNEPIITEEAKAELEEKLKAFAKFDYTIVEQRAGIRPTVSDRRPLIGRHAEVENVLIFNGLGTKGVLIAPFYAKQLMDFMEGKAVLDGEVDIKRYQNK